jgi:hypothetical protein
MLTQELIGFGAGRIGAASVAFGDSDVRASPGSTTFTATALGIGTAAGDRYVVVAVSWRASSGTPTVSSVTVGGAATTVVVSSGSGTTGLALYITSAPFTSGTTADVVLTLSASCTNAGFGAFALTGLGSASAVETNSGTTDNTAMTLSAAADVCVSAGASFNATTFTQSGTTEQYDAQSGSSLTHSGGMAAPAPASVTYDAASPSTFRQVVATWS